MVNTQVAPDALVPIEATLRFHMVSVPDDTLIPVPGVIVPVVVVNQAHSFHAQLATEVPKVETPWTESLVTVVVTRVGFASNVL